MKPQSAQVRPAVENDRVGPRSQKPSQSKAPIRCQLWDYRRLVGVVPVTLDEMGHPSDVIFDPSSVEKVTRIAFVWGGKIFAHPLPEPVIIKPGNPLHLALGHLRLLDRFGNNALEAGKA